MRADGRFKVVPHTLSELLVRLPLRRLDGLKDMHLIAPIWQRQAHTGDDRQPQPACELHVQSGHTRLQAKVLDHRGRAARLHIQVRQQPRVALALQRLHQPQHRALLGDDRVPRVLTQAFENARQRRVFEVLRHHRKFKIPKAPK